MASRRQRSARRAPSLELLERRSLLSLASSGGEFLVNGTETGHQSMPQVAMDADGDFVATWSDSVNLQNDLRVRARLFDSAGRPRGADFTVNSRAGLMAYMSDVAMDDDGDFVIAWQGGAWGDDSSYGLYARRFNAQGEPQGPEFLVSTPGTKVVIGSPNDVGLAMGDDGDFVIAWSEADPATDNQPTILRARQFGASGEPLGETFRVDTALTGTHTKIGMSAGMDDAGGFLIAWRDVSDLSFTRQKPEIYARRYDGSGAAQGPEFRVNVKTRSDLWAPALGMAGDGGAVITWSDWGDSGEPTGGVYGRRVDGSGELDGSQFQVSSITNGSSSYGYPATVAMAGDGSFAVTWLNWDLSQPKVPVPGGGGGETSPVLGIHFQQYTAGAHKERPDRILNIGNGRDNGFPAVAIDAAAEHAVVVWDRDDTDNQQVDGDAIGRFLTVDDVPTSDPDPDPDPDSGPDPHPDPGPTTNDAPTTTGIPDVVVDQDAGDTVIPLFDVFADAEDADPSLHFQLAANTNAGLFSSVSVDPASGLLSLGYAPGASGGATLIVRATDTAGAFVDATFDVTVRPAPAPPPSPTPDPTPDPDAGAGGGLAAPPTAAPVAKGTKSITGKLLQKSGRRKVGVAGVRVFLDADDDGVFDAGEPAAVTGADGSFVLSGLAAGKYRVRLADGSGWRVASRREHSAVAARHVLVRARQRRVARVKPFLLEPVNAL